MTTNKGHEEQVCCHSGYPQGQHLQLRQCHPGKVCFSVIIESYEVQTVILKDSSNCITKTGMKALRQVNNSKPISNAKLHSEHIVNPQIFD